MEQTTGQTNQPDQAATQPAAPAAAAAQTPDAAQTATDAQRYAAALAQLGRTLTNSEVAILNSQSGQLEVFDLHNMTAAQADQLRASMPQAFQDQAQDVETLLLNFQSVSSIALPQGVTWEQIQQRVGPVMAQVSQGVSQFSSPVDRFINEHHADMPIIQTMAASAQATANTAGGVVNNMVAMGDGWNRGGMAVDNDFGLGRELDIAASRFSGSTLDENQRKAVATAIVAESYRSMMEHGAPLPDATPADTRPNLMDNGWALFQVAGSMLAHMLPVEFAGINLRQIAVQIGVFIDNAFSGQFDWDAAGVQAQHILAEEHTVPGFGDFANRNAHTRVAREHETATHDSRVDAAVRMNDVGSVAGVSNVPQIAALVAEGGPYRDPQGLLWKASYVDGQLSTTPLQGADGHQLTLADERRAAIAGLTPPANAWGWPTYALNASLGATWRYGVPALVTVSLGSKVAHGVARQTIGGGSAMDRSDHMDHGRLNAKSVSRLQTLRDNALRRADELANGTGVRQLPLEMDEARYRAHAATLDGRIQSADTASRAHADAGLERHTNFTAPNFQSPRLNSGSATINRYVNETLHIGDRVDNAWVSRFAAQSTTAVGRSGLPFFRGIGDAIWNFPGRAARVLGDAGGRVIDETMYHGGRLVSGGSQVIRRLGGGQLVDGAAELLAKAAPLAGAVLRRVAPPVAATLSIHDNLDSIGIGQTRDVHDRIRGTISLTAILAAGGVAAADGAAIGGATGALAGGVGAIPGAIIGGVVGFCGGAATASLGTWIGGMGYDALDSGYQGREAQRRAAEEAQRQRQQPQNQQAANDPATQALLDHAAQVTARTPQQPVSSVPDITLTRAVAAATPFCNARVTVGAVAGDPAAPGTCPAPQSGQLAGTGAYGPSNA